MEDAMSKNVIRIEDLPPGAQAQARRQIENLDKRKWSNARKVEADGEVFRSRAEYIRWKELKAMEAAGEILCLRHEKIRFTIGRDDRGRPLTWLPDLTYFRLGCECYPYVEEVKGRRGRDFGTRLALFRKVFPEWSVLVNGKEVE
jgi:hypothetical protein